jgi:hypothetical protein
MNQQQGAHQHKLYLVISLDLTGKPRELAAMQPVPVRKGKNKDW